MNHAAQCLTHIRWKGILAEVGFLAEFEMKGREKSGKESGNGFQLCFRDILLTALGAWGGQAGDEGVMRTGILDLAPWLSAAGL